MKALISAAVVFFALSLVAADSAWARSRGGSGGQRSGQHSRSYHHHHHARSGVFVGAFAGAALWPWWGYPVYVRPEEPVHYLERGDEGAGEWLYCSGAGTYFPYIAECPGGWQSVRPGVTPE